ncbi:uncharacterized protein Hap1MRO34_000750 isoform 1-T2 [Clarias gariepinus]|uniref:membrane-spanning 4-domains subfamily A member 4D n=1 Tax=Clarias gariepinus TaxID=13013 RepID=UPI00234CFE5E|nr:membrane-spanning 4-domains subfamily A member 4D [Clarias gariepinus]XP_053343558.1 membrane-spanning 4-domains subfamily A member 4D [Clarias gariepinus]
MRYTFKPDDCMVITIPLGSIRNAREGQLMPDKFTCRFKDSYKVFQRGRPKALGAAQIITAVFILCLGGILISFEMTGDFFLFPFVLSFIMYLLCGSLTITSGHTPLMPVMKASFIFNIFGLAVAVGLIVTCVIEIIYLPWCRNNNMCKGLGVVASVLYAFEFLLSAILIHWESKAMCRTHFNTLPMITLKQDM